MSFGGLFKSKEKPTGGSTNTAGSAGGSLASFYSLPPPTTGAASLSTPNKNTTKRTEAEYDEFGPDISHASAADQQNEQFQPAVKHRSAQDILNDLDERYMLEDFDPVKELFNNLPPDSDDTLTTRLHELELVQSTIDKKLSSQVFKNYASFVEGLALITDISSELKASQHICISGRDQLKVVDKRLTHSILSTLQKRRTQARCNVVIIRLHEVYALLRKENEINALLKKDEFIKSVSIYKQCLKTLAQSGLNKFTCLDALRARFLRTAELISNQVKDRLLSLSKKFQVDAFRNLIQAMVNLGDYKVLSEYLRKFISIAIEENASEAVTPFLAREYLQSLMAMQVSQGLAKAMLDGDKKEQRGNGVAIDSSSSATSSPTPSTPSSSNGLSSPSPPPPPHVFSPTSLTPADIASLPRKPFKDMCAHLDLKQFSLAFLTLSAKLMDNLYAVQQMVIILSEIVEEERKKGQHHQTSSTSSSSTSHTSSEADAICSALDHALAYLHESRSTIWAKICSFFIEFFSGNYLSVTHISVDDFVRVLKNGNEFVMIGEEFVKGGGSSGPTSIVIDTASPTPSPNHLDASPTGSPTPSSVSLTPYASPPPLVTPPSLRAVLLAKSNDYIRNFLKESLTNLSTTFAQESFRPLLVEPDFQPEKHVKEFKSLVVYLEQERQRKEQLGGDASSSPSSSGPSSTELWESFLNGSNPFTRAILDQKNEYEVRLREAAIAAERKAAAEAARLAASSRPPLRAPGSGPVRAAALNLSVGRPKPNFVLPTTGGMTGGVPTVQPRALAQAQAAEASGAASASSTASPARQSLSLLPGQSLLTATSTTAPPPESSRPFVLACTLALTKIFGKYLALFRSFPNQGLEALNGLQDCLEFFVYTYVMTFGTGQQGFFASPSSSQSQNSIHAELHPSPASPTYLIESYPTLRALLTSVKNRVELGSFGGGSGGSIATGTVWAREWKQDDVVAAASALQQAQSAWNEVQASQHHGASSNGTTLNTMATTPTSLISPNSGAPQTLAAAASAQAAAAANFGIEKKEAKEKDSFFSKLKEKMSSTSDKDKERGRERESISIGAAHHHHQQSQQATLNAVSVAANHLAAVSAAHPPPQLVQFATKIAHDLESSDVLYGLVHRMHAVESLVFVFQLFNDHRDLITQLLPDTTSTHKRINQFHSYLDAIGRELQHYLYGCAAPILLPKEVFLSKLNSCRWDIKDLQTKYNTYVDTILNTLRVNEMSLQSSGGLPPPLLKKLWSCMLEYLTEQLVEAYSKAKKCTTEGRGLMTLDLSALRAGLEKLTNLKPLPHWEFVLGWVNAYYLQESEFLAWVTAHPEYTMSQVLSISTCGCGASKPSKERLVLNGNVTNAHALSVERARKERDENARKKKSNSSTSATSTSSTVEATSTTATVNATGTTTSGIRSRPPSEPNSRSMTPSSSHENLKELAATTPITNGSTTTSTNHANGHPSSGSGFHQVLDKVEDGLP